MITQTLPPMHRPLRPSLGEGGNTSIIELGTISRTKTQAMRARWAQKGREAFFLAGLLIVSALPVNVLAASRPNVIVVNIDNHNKGSLGYYGNTFIETPNIDRLIQEGVRFENYMCSARCTSSRSELLTGRYHARNGALGTAGAWGFMREGLTTMAHVFAGNGYQTAMFGKWHLGEAYPLCPEDRGFQEALSCENGTTLAALVTKKGYSDSPRVGEAFRFNHNGTYKEYKGFRTDIWFRELSSYMEKKRDPSKPFFVYLATVTEHEPTFGPKDLRDKYKAKYESEPWQKFREEFEANRKGKNKGKETVYPYDHAADMESLDRNIGRLIKQLEALHLLDNTVVVYMSDGIGGGPATVKPKEGSGAGAPMCVRYPPFGQGKAVNTLVANFDVLPTLAEICGIQLTPEMRGSIDGRSFASLLGMPDVSAWKECVYIDDHQSAYTKPDNFGNQMIFLPYNNTSIYLPGGAIVSYVQGRCTAKGVSEEEIAAARTAYDVWLKRVIADFPLGAFAKAHPSRPVFINSYPITDGPGWPGEHPYFLLDIGEDGTYELDTNMSDRYGRKFTAKGGGKQSGTLVLCKKLSDAPLPAGFDETFKGYRVLPKTLAENFSVETRMISFPALLSLKQGRYIFTIKPDSGNPPGQLRVERK